MILIGLLGPWKYIYVFQTWGRLTGVLGSPGESQGSGVALLFAFHCVMVVCTIELKGIGREGREGEGCKLDHRF